MEENRIILADEDSMDVEQFEKQVNESYEELIKRNEALEKEVSELRAQLEATVDAVHFLEGQLQKIRGNRFYRILASVYKFFRKKKSSNSVREINSQSSVMAMIESFRDQGIMAKPLVSIIIPVYNNASYLEKCIDSAISQTYSNIEVVVLDDCSPDPRVKQILEKYRTHVRMKLLRNEKNMGICDATNNAMLQANGEWFAFLDCDDWLEPDAIETVMDELKKNPDARFAYTNRMNCNNATGERELVDFSCRPTFNYEDNLIVGMYTSHLKVIRRDVFVRIGLYDKEYNGTQDYDISLKIAHYYGDSAFLFIKKPVYNHRIHEAQTTNVQDARMISTAARLVNMGKLRQSIRAGTYNEMVSIVVLSFNKCEQTLECIESIRNTVKIPYEIILWDNKSNDKTVSKLKEEYGNSQDIRLFFSEENIGCGGGRRAAVKHAKGSMVVFLDNDIVVKDDWLTELIVRMNSRENVAAVNSRVVFPDGNVQICGMRCFEDNGFVTFSLTGANRPMTDLSSCVWMKNDWINGGATLFRKDVFTKLTGLEEYPNAFEDNDASYQMKKMGYTLLNCPISVVVHNHINYVEANKVEKEYLEARYNNEKMIVSAITFYKRNGLIINDEYIFRLMELNANDRDRIKAYFQQRLKAMQKTAMNTN